MNLKKWLGHPTSYARDYRFWFKKCRCRKYGTDLENFSRALYAISDIRVSPRNRPTVESICQALSQGYAVLMKSAYAYNGEVEGHYFLIVGCESGKLSCVNVYDTHCQMTKKEFRREWLQHHWHYCDGCGIAPYAWFVRKVT